MEESPDSLPAFLCRERVSPSHRQHAPHQLLSRHRKLWGESLTNPPRIRWPWLVWLLIAYGIYEINWIVISDSSDAQKGPSNPTNAPADRFRLSREHGIDGDMEYGSVAIIRNIVKLPWCDLDINSEQHGGDYGSLWTTYSSSS